MWDLGLQEVLVSIHIIVQPLTMTNSLLAVEDIQKCSVQIATANNQLTINPKDKEVPCLYIKCTSTWLEIQVDFIRKVA